MPRRSTCRESNSAIMAGTAASRPSCGATSSTTRSSSAIAEVIHEADIEDDRFDAPAAPGLDVIIRGLSITLDDDAVLAATAPIFDGLYEYFRRGLVLGRDPS